MSVVVGHWMNEWVVGLKKINSQNLTDQRLKSSLLLKFRVIYMFKV